MPRHKQSDPTSIKSSVIRLRVTEAKAEKFRSKAAESGCKTVSKYIRSRCIPDDSSIDKTQVVHMLPGYTHNIINRSETETLVTVMWANEQFAPNHPDTFFEKV